VTTSVLTLHVRLTFLRLIAPAQNYVKYETREMTYMDWDDSSKYFGKPSDEVDANWQQLDRCKYLGETSGLPY
jgi:hypothetical protein